MEILPLFLMGVASTWTQLRQQASLSVVGKVDPVTATDQEKAKVKELFAQLKPGIVKLPAMTQPESRQFHASHLREILEAFPSLRKDGYESLLASMIIMAWTAFEVLATDLWVKAINFQPDWLAQLSGPPKRISGQAGAGRDQDEEESDDNSKLIKLHRLSRCQFDIQHRMGDVLRDRFKFINLRGIRKAYSTAFSDKFPTTAIDKALGDKSLDALAVARNVLVHSGGKADGWYKIDSKPVQDVLPKLNEGEPLKLDGDLMVKLIRPALACCSELTAGVDEWLIEAEREISRRGSKPK